MKNRISYRNPNESVVKPVISVIIVTYNALDHLRNYLPSVVESAHDSFEIIIADNASSDGSVDWIREHCPSCQIVSFTRNFGYCGGNNRAADHANGDLLLFLNNDVKVEPGWLQPLAKLFDDPETAVAQPKIRSLQDPHLFEYAGAAGGYLDNMGYPFCRGRVFDTIEEDHGQYDDSPPLFWASGAAFAVRKDLFQEMGGFDERFEFHMEEIDFCWRCLNQGYNIRFAPDSIVYHLGGGSLPMNSSRKTFFNFRNNLQMLWKNASSEWLRRRFFIRLLLDGLAGLYALLKGHPTDTWAIFRAHLHFYLLWPRVHKRRKLLQSTRTNDIEPEEMAPFSILYRYFIRRSRTWKELYEV